MHSQFEQLVPLNVSVITVSDTRDESTDKSGAFLADAARGAGHHVVHREIVVDDLYQIRAVVSDRIAAADTQVILLTGGTGFRHRDVTPEAVAPLLDREIPGFGEYFRALSTTEIGTSTMQSRVLGGIANRTLVFCLPGSTNACRTAWNGIFSEQLDATHRPCNFVEILGVEPVGTEAKAS
ncbi:MAG: molybdenum cofactor biosynthesis protein B [Xanthomonadales bacterium]|nr:molybdenum cofactor biosynthesis protein B [Xanthomonadales bacterium]